MNILHIQINPTPLTIEKSAFLKCVLSILIVLFHLHNQIPVGLLKYLDNFGPPIVSLFFFLSGYGLMVCREKKGEKYLDTFFINRIIKNLIIPFVLASCIYRLINGSTLPDIQESIYNCYRLGDTAGLLPNSWFVFALFCFYLLFYMVQKGAFKHPVLILSIFILIYVVETVKAGFDWSWYITAFAFPIGVLYATNETRLLHIWQKNSSIVLTMIICVACMACLKSLHSMYANMVIYMIFPSFVACMFSKFGDFHNLGTIINSIAKCSYEIYLYHGVVMLMLRSDVLYIESNTVYIFFTFVITFIVSFIMSNVRIRLCS